MTDAILNTKKRRKPLLALILSLVEPGLGHIYCGRIVKGLVLAFIASVIIPVFFATLSVSYSRVRMAVILISLFAFVLVWLTAIIDSFLAARHTRPDYELKDYNRWYVYVIVILMSTAGSSQISLNVRSNLMEAFRVPVLSMYPTINSNDRFLANKITYKNDDPQRGDVIVFICPDDRRVNYVKRVVAVAGDTVEMIDNQLYVNGKKLESKAAGQSSFEGQRGTERGKLFIEKNGQAEYKIFISDIDSEQIKNHINFPDTTVPENHCFVLGDNRNHSRDSRYFGPVPLATVKGRADYLYWPSDDWSRFGKIK